MNKEFLQKITILYVEDDPTIREEFHTSIEKIFKEIVVAQDGKEALELFNEHKNTIDLIISDINMPNMDGIELLKEIKKTNPEMPFIFTTAYTDEKYLIEGIKNKVSDYFVKPAGLLEMISKIEKVCQKKVYEQKIKHQENQTKEYFDLMNKVAIVYIFDHEGKLIFANDFLTELLGVKDTSQLYGNDYKTIFYPDISKEILNDQWEKLNNGEIWKGKLKYITQHKTAFFTNATIMSAHDDKNPDLKKFISVNFLTTKEENERKEFKKQLMYDIQEAKRIFRVAQEKIDALNKEIEKYTDVEEKQKLYLELKAKAQESFQKLQTIEARIKAVKNKFELLTQGVNSKISKIAIAIKNMKEDTDKNTKKIYKLTSDVKLRDQFIEKIKLDIQEKNHKIENLEDVLNLRIKEKEGKL